MQRLVTLILIIVLQINALTASSFLIEELTSLNASPSQDLPPPNPADLNPQWKNYFNVDNDELRQRISTTLTNLHQIYLALPIEEQLAASTIINKINTTLNALPMAKQENIQQAINSKPFLQSYTFDKQIELNQQIRKLKATFKKDSEQFQQSKSRLEKANKELDNLMVKYLGQTQQSSSKLMNGFNIISLGANISLAEQNLKHSEQLLDEQTKRIEKLEEEILFAQEHLDVQDANLATLESNMGYFQNNLEKTLVELTYAETNLLGSLNNVNNRDQQLLLEHQLLQASVNRAYAWTKLAFHTLKYNWVMLLNNNFHEQNTLRQDLDDWREKIATIRHQAQDWKISVLREQDNIRQEFASFIAQQTLNSEPKLLRNQSQKDNLQSILTTLELLQEDIANSEWLVDILDLHFQQHSNFLQNWWVNLVSFVNKAWNSSMHILNFSLFKISGVPITLTSILKMLLIISISFWLSIYTRSAMIKSGKKRGIINESTLHSLGGLARYFILFIGIIIALCSIGLDFSSFIFIAGALMFGISLGLQSIANNFFCGLRILFERKLKIGDEIELNTGHHGKVTEIHVQNTVVKTSDGQKIIVPNSELIDNTVVNWTRHSIDYRRLHVPFSVAAGSDKELVRKIVIDACYQVPCTLRNLPEYDEPQVWLTNFNRHTLDFKLVVWVDYKAESVTDSREADFLWEIESALQQYRVTLPNTILDLIPNLSISRSV